MNGPQYYAAAAAHLAEAESFGVHRDAAAFDRHMCLFEANATMARLALDAARAAATGELSDAAEIYSDAMQDRTDAMHANYTAWVAAIAGGGVR